MNERFSVGSLCSLRDKFCVLFSNHTVEAAGGRALPCIVNVRQEEQIISAVEEAVKTFGGMLWGRGHKISQGRKEHPNLLYSCFSF